MTENSETKKNDTAETKRRLDDPVLSDRKVTGVRVGWKCTECGALVEMKGYSLLPCPKCKKCEFVRVAIVEDTKLARQFAESHRPAPDSEAK